MDIKFNVKGTEKQVKWCEDILKNFNEFMRDIKQEDIKTKKGEITEETKESYSLAEKIVNAINNEDAGLIIQEKEMFNTNVFFYTDILMNYAKKLGEDENKLFYIVKYMRQLAK